MKDLIKELNQQKQDVANLEHSIMLDAMPRLEQFCSAMRKIENTSPIYKTWSDIQYPHTLTDDGYSSFTIDFAIEDDDSIVVSWGESEYICGSSDERCSSFIVHNILFTDLGDTYIKTRVKKYKKDIKALAQTKDEKGY